MMGQDTEKQFRLIYVNLDDYVPQNHLLRAIQETIDFSFIYDKVRHLYSNIGRRSIDPVLLIKMLLLGYLNGITSERKLEEEVKLNLAYRWFLGLDLADPVPDHSTFSQNRRRRFKKSGIFQEIFDHIVSQCIAQGLVTGEVIVTDSTHIKANASIQKVEKVIVEKAPSEYLLDLENESRRLEDELRAKKGNGKQNPEKKPKTTGKKVVKEEKQSITDPDARLMSRPGKPAGFHYLSHVSIDPECGIITDIHVTPGNVNDHQPYIERLRRQKKKFGLNIKKVGADKGYDYAEVHHGLKKLKIDGYVSTYERSTGSKSIKVKEFVYDKDTDTYKCPAGKILSYKSISRQDNGTKTYKIYRSSAKDCKSCPQRNKCLSSTVNNRKLYRPIFQEAIEENTVRTKTLEYTKIQRLRSIWCEGTFGILKEKHNMRKTYLRGIDNVQEQCLLWALAINIKRMVKALA